MLGSVGYVTGEWPAERIWRDVKIGEGSSENQHPVIARGMLKEIGSKV